MDFPYPDEDDCLPPKGPIETSSPNDSSLTTTLPLSVIFQEVDQNSKMPVVISNNPGRFDLYVTIYTTSLFYIRSPRDHH